MAVAVCGGLAEGADHGLAGGRADDLPASGDVLRCGDPAGYAEGLPLIPVREEFLNDHRLMRLIAADGIHLTMPGYERLFDTLADWLRIRV